jgi:hypothetical protein
MPQRTYDTSRNEDMLLELKGIRDVLSKTTEALLMARQAERQFLFAQPKGQLSNRTNTSYFSDWVQVEGFTKFLCGLLMKEQPNGADIQHLVQFGVHQHIWGDCGMTIAGCNVLATSAGAGAQPIGDGVTTALTGSIQNEADFVNPYDAGPSVPGFGGTQGERISAAVTFIAPVTRIRLWATFTLSAPPEIYVPEFYIWAAR